MANPPQLVKEIFDAVLILLGYKQADLTWINAKKLMNDPAAFAKVLNVYDP